MRVLVTGGTGFVGSHSVAALRGAGHEVRLLVRSPEKLAPTLDPPGTVYDEIVEGDVTDPAVVRAAVTGCDAVLHTASIFSFRGSDRDRVEAVNVGGTETVLATAVEEGLDPVVHVSTCLALLPVDGPVVTADTPVGDPPGIYASSKASAERVARTWQERGAPVVITHPGAVFGPHDPALGYANHMLVDVLRIPGRPGIDGRMAAVDVRDVAAVHAAVMRREQGPRRYLATGHTIRHADLVSLAGRVTGRRLLSPTVPSRLASSMAGPTMRLTDTLRLRAMVSPEGLWSIEQDRHYDAEPTVDALGTGFRPLEETIADTIAWLVGAGHLGKRYAGLAG